jgi:erythromycin esterase
VEETAELYKWLREKSVHLKTVAAGSGFDDMQPLKTMIGDARIVALGEAAHLNRDFYRVKHRMVEFLVNEMDFTVFAIEATFAGALELNDYILTGDGTPEDALAALVYPAWRTEAVLEMVKWMRHYNATHEKKIKFYGFDNGTKDYEQLLLSLMQLSTTLRKWEGPNEELRKSVEQIKGLITYLKNQRSAHARSPSQQEIQSQRQWSLAVRHAKVLLQNAEFLSAPSISKATDLRDKSMADNVRWLMDYEKGAKIILWAANPHIMTTPYSRSMGDYLRRACGKDMVVFGLMRNRESDALSPDSTDQGYGAPKGSVEALLTEAGLDMAVINLRSLPKGAVSKYFNAPRKTGSIANLLPWAYDAILFIESTTNARPVGASIP